MALGLQFYGEHDMSLEVGGGIMSPYLQQGRLQDVIAALTALSNYRYYKLDYRSWAEKIANSPGDADKWKKILKEHPEFFRDSEDKRVSLVWRRQFQKRYSPQFQRELSYEEYAALSEEHKGRLTRRPLVAEELSRLISLAVELHAHALERKKSTFGWVAAQGAVGVMGGAGAIIVAWLLGLMGVR
jgi:hypothetical protein